MIRTTSQVIRGAIFAGAAIVSAAFTNQAEANTNSAVVKIDSSEQRMNAIVSGVHMHKFKESTVGKRLP